MADQKSIVAILEVCGFFGLIGFLMWRAQGVLNQELSDVKAECAIRGWQVTVPNPGAYELTGPLKDTGQWSFHVGLLPNSSGYQTASSGYKIRWTDNKGYDTSHELRIIPTAAYKLMTGGLGKMLEEQSNKALQNTEFAGTKVHFFDKGVAKQMTLPGWQDWTVISTSEELLHCLSEQSVKSILEKWVINKDITKRSRYLTVQLQAGKLSLDLSCDPHNATTAICICELGIALSASLRQFAH